MLKINFDFQKSDLPVSAQEEDEKIQIQY